MRALLVCSLYNMASFRRLCSAISENLACGWFCFLTIDDPVFDHSGISHFIDWIGRNGCAAIFDGLNNKLLRLGMLTPEMYVDAILVKANVNGYGLESIRMPAAEFKEQAVEANGLFVLTKTAADDDCVEPENVWYFQSPEGRLPLDPVDTDARWKTARAGKASGLHYQENVIIDLDGFILPCGLTHASERNPDRLPNEWTGRRRRRSPWAWIRVAAYADQGTVDSPLCAQRITPVSPDRVTAGIGPADRRWPASCRCSRGARGPAASG